MRIWDLSAKRLCRAHLLGEHRELHAIWAVLTKGKKGYSRHPETLRWKGRLKALYRRHDDLVKEMSGRGYKHHSPLALRLATGTGRQTMWVNTKKEQVLILRSKKCECRV